MEENNPIQSINTVLKSFLNLLSLTGLYFIFTIVFASLGMQAAGWATGTEINPDFNTLDVNNLDAGTIFGYKLFQLIASFGSFIVTALVFTRFFARESPAEFLGFKRTVPNAKILGLTLLIGLAAIPAISLIATLNQQIPLPADWVETADKLQATNDGLNRAFLQAPSIWVLLLNLLVIAIIPAIGEELLFRGAFLQLIYRFSKQRIHLSIVVVAIMFSVMHLQYYNFFAILFMGVVFGYLYFWSGNIMVAVWAHFINNGTAVLFAYIQQHNPDMEFLGYDYEFSPLIGIAGLLVMAGAMWLFYKTTQQYHAVAVEESEETEEHADE